MNELKDFSISTDLMIRLEDANRKIGDVNVNDSPLLQRDLNELYSILSEKMAGAELTHARAKTESEKQYALALLERSQGYFDIKGTKPTDTLRKAYADIDPEYLKAKDEESKAKAFLTYLQGKLQTAQQGYYSSKRVFEKSSNLSVIKE